MKWVNPQDKDNFSATLLHPEENMSSIQNNDAALAAPPKRRPYTPQEWESKKELIAQYIREERSQKEMLELLEKDSPDFRPTISMLKKRLRKWDLGRNNREADIAEALNIAFQRETQSKKTSFIIRQTPKNEKEIKRYLRRKGISDARTFTAKSHKKTSVTTSIVSYTPERTPPPEEPEKTQIIEEVEEIEEIEEIIRDNNQLEVHTSSTRRQIFNTLRGPPELEILLTALKSTDAYYTSAFCPTSSDNPWTALATERLDVFTNGMWKGREFIIEGQNESGFKCFDVAMKAITDTNAFRSRRFLPELFEMLLNFQQNFEVLRMLLQYIQDLCKDKGHDSEVGFLIPILSSLLNVNFEDNYRYDTAERLMSHVLSHFQAGVGEQHPESKSIMKAISRSVYRKKPVSEAINDLKAVIADESSFKDHFEYCNVLVELALLYRLQNDYENAVAWIETAWNETKKVESLFHQTDTRVRCLRILSSIEKRRMNYGESLKHARDAVTYSVNGMGNEDSLTALVQEELAELLEGMALTDN